MANLKRIKNQIVAIEKTSQITKAMYSISASKIKKSESQVLNFTNFSKEFNDIFKLFNNYYDDYQKSNGEYSLYILITSDRGLLGNYHSSLFKYFKEILTNDLHAFIYPIGRKGYLWAKKENLRIISAKIILNKDNLELINLADISSKFQELFLKGINKISLIYNKSLSGQDFKPTEEIIFPLAVSKEKNKNDLYELDGNISNLKEQILSIYLETSIYKALLEAKKCEHYKRMMAMKAASDNAENIITKLKLKYHQARQNQITSELIDIVSGANN